MNQAEIMSRVLFLHRLRRTWYSPWTKVALLTALVASELLLVSVLEVIKNAWQTRDLFDISRYIISAFIQTDLAVQILFATFALVAVLLVRDVIKNLRSHRQFATI